MSEPVHDRDHRPLDGVAKVLVGLLALAVALALVDLLRSAFQLAHLLDLDLPADAGISFEDARGSFPDVGVPYALGSGAVRLVTAVLFVTWFYRAYRNLEALGRPGRFGSGWAIGGWFVPVMWWWRPKQIANDLWSNTSRGPEPDPLPRWLLAWWIAVVVASLPDPSIFAARRPSGPSRGWRQCASR